MTQSALFSSGIELASFVTNSVLLHKSWDATTSGIVPNVGEGISWKVSKEPDDSGLTFIAFEVTQEDSSKSNLQEDLVSSYDLKEKNFHHFEFLRTKNTPFFSVNKTAISLLDTNYEKLDQLKSEINSSSRLVVTGVGLGGRIASLFTLSLLGSISNDEKKKPLLCITFGSPLVGDRMLQEAISRSSVWSSCFLHVVSIKDPLPKRLNPQSHTNAYMPFGTFLFCSDMNTSTCFENPESVLKLLMSSINDQNQEFQPKNYGNIVKNLKGREICKDLTPRGQDLTHSNSLGASICLQLWAALGIGLTPDYMQHNIDMDTLVTNMEKLEKKFIPQKRAKIDPSKKLNIMKRDMAQLEWYKKNSKDLNIGYYDKFKNMCMPDDKKTKLIRNMPSDHDVNCYFKSLTKYWVEEVEEVELKPQKKDAAFRTRWLYGGTNYRRMVEPLVIAQYYAEGGANYMTEKRSKHFVLLEKWLKEDTTKAKSNSNSNSNSNNTDEKNVESILTFDSCFWAHVEEALISCKVLLENVQSSVTEKDEATGKLLKFEKYVYGLLRKYEVSSEIFLWESSYITWWNQYKAIKGTSYNSPLKDFMRDPKNYNEQYAKGTYNFPRGRVIIESSVK